MQATPIDTYQTFERPNSDIPIRQAYTGWRVVPNGWESHGGLACNRGVGKLIGPYLTTAVLSPNHLCLTGSVLESKAANQCSEALPSRA